MMKSHLTAMTRQALRLLDQRDRRRFAWLMLLSVVLAMVEIAGIGSIVPFIAVLAGSGGESASPWLTDLRDWLGIEDERRLLTVLGFAVIAFMTLRNVFFALSNLLVALFTALCRRNLAARLLDAYLTRPYAYFLTRNTNELRRNVFQESSQIIDGVLVPVTRIVSSACVAIAILAMLIVTDPVAAITTVVVLGGAYVATYRFTGARIDRLGQTARRYRQHAFQIGAEAFGGIKDLKLLGRESQFIDGYRRIAAQATRVEMRRNAFGLIPRYLIETLAVAGVILFLLHLAQRGEPLSRMLPVLALYLLAGYRVLPALQTIYANLGQMRYNRAALATLHQDLEGARELTSSAGAHAPATPLPFRESIRLDCMSFSYPQAAAPALREVDLVIHKNTAVAFVGATGAGKSTLVDLIMGLLLPDAGRVLIDDVVLAPDNVRAWQRNIGYVPQHIWLSDDTVARNIAFGVPDREIDHDAVRAAAKAASLDQFIENELPKGYATVIGERGIRLSGGQRQRVGIARALYHRPSVIVFDEATSALDGATERAIIEAIDGLARRITIILIAHRLNTVINCDRIFVLEHGRLVDSGRYTDLVQESGAFQRLAR
jgi:ABC-type multidrug transport system fused ATPase/permease subunit